MATTYDHGGNDVKTSRTLPLFKDAGVYMRRKVTRGTRTRIKLPYWILVRTKSRQELYAAKNIERQGLRTFCPRYLPNDRKWKLETLFPSYLFVEVVGAFPHFLHNTFGVSSIHMRGGVVERVPRRVIEEIMSWQDADGIIHLHEHDDTPDPPIEYRDGDTLMIERGSFQKHLVLYDGVTPDDRIRVLFEFMGKLVEMKMHRKEVRLATESELKEGATPPSAVATPKK